jgi:hypothetical protein
VDDGPRESRCELGDVDRTGFRGPHADRSVGSDEPLELWHPRVTGGDHRHGDLRPAACDLAGVVEEICDRRGIERLERRAIGIEERSHGGTFGARHGSRASNFKSHARDQELHPVERAQGLRSQAQTRLARR